VTSYGGERSCGAIGCGGVVGYIKYVRCFVSVSVGVGVGVCSGRCKVLMREVDAVGIEVHGGDNDNGCW